MRKILSIALALVLSMTGFLLVSCGDDSSSDPDTFVVGFTNINDIYDYCVRFRDYLAYYADEFGMELIVMDAAGDANVQNGQIDDMIVRGAKIVTSIPADLDGSVPGLEAAKAAGLPYISFLASVRDGHNYPGYIYIGSENYDAGFMQGEYLAGVLPQNAIIIYFTMQPNEVQAMDRRAGLMDALASRPDVEIVVELNVEARRDLAINATEDVLQSIEHFDAIVSQNDDAALGVVEALLAAGRLEGVTVIGLDGSPDALASVAAGELSMTVLQNPRAQAKAGVEVFAKIRDGVDPTTIDDVFVPFEIITIDNVSDFME